MKPLATLPNALWLSVLASAGCTPQQTTGAAHTSPRAGTQPVPANAAAAPVEVAAGRPRVIVTSDGEIDDECSMVRFLLYANEWEVEAIVTSSSQYHWQGHNWAGDNWLEPYLGAYEQVYPNLLQHSADFPTPEYLRQRSALGNVKAEGEMEELTAGSQLIAEVLLDESDARPVWLQAWGGPNTIARALKTIEEVYPEKMAMVAAKLRFYFIWEQDNTYQRYILPHWGHFNIPTIISDQFEAIAYRWPLIQPESLHRYFSAPWMTANILEGHGPLCSLYRSHEAEDGDADSGRIFQKGDFRSEGDSPAFLHTIPTGLRSLESPGFGGWGGRFVRVRDNTWLDPAPYPGYAHPEGRYFTHSTWGRGRLREGATSKTDPALLQFFRPAWRWSAAMQNDFAARADWCVMPRDAANHEPRVELAHPEDLKARPGARVALSAAGTSDPDGDRLTYAWWPYREAGSYPGAITLEGQAQRDAWLQVPSDAQPGQTLHLVCEVTDDGTPALTRYRRVVVEVE